MRIISGTHKGKRFEPPSNTKARPTTDQAKEALFNILENSYYNGFESLSVLDLFSGTGNISFEFASRSCADITAIEVESKQVNFIKSVIEKLDFDLVMRVIRADVFKYLQSKSEKKYDFIFADPPYDLHGIINLPQKIFDSGKLSPTGLLVVEHGPTHSFAEHPHFAQQRNYGKVHFSFFDPEVQNTINTDQSTASPESVED